jgi:hypothetical protein
LVFLSSICYYYAFALEALKTATTIRKMREEEERRER